MLPLSRLARVGQVGILLKDAKTIIFSQDTYGSFQGGPATLEDDNWLEE